jgi:hypothetical protein
LTIENKLRERLRKAEALFFGAATAGERVAAGAAMGRLRARLEEAAEADPPVEVRYSLPDAWSKKLFIALCRRYGFKPYRYARQRHTTLMVKAPRRLFEQVVWSQFLALHEDLELYLAQTTEMLIREAIHADSSEEEVAPEPPALR